MTFMRELLPFHGLVGLLDVPTDQVTSDEAAAEDSGNEAVWSDERTKWKGRQGRDGPLG